MRIHKTSTGLNSVILTITANETDLAAIKQQVLQHLASTTKVAGFRIGKAPLSLVEKNTNPATLQSHFLEDALEQLYVQAIKESGLRVVQQLQLSLSKFVPFTDLEFKAELEVIGDVDLPDYKRIKKTKPTVKLSDDDIKQVLNSLQKRVAERHDAKRAAKEGDEVVIDFIGRNTKGEAIKGADGKDYPLLLGSDTFIPGFEKNLIGTKVGEKKTFSLNFPKDYGLKSLASKQVTFEVSINKVQEVLLPKIDDSFASKVGPFKTLNELKADIKKQLSHEKQHEADRKFESELVQSIANKSTLSIPQVLIDDQVEQLIKDAKQVAIQRGQTFAEFLEMEGKTEESYKKDILKPQAEERVKAGLILAEVAELEGIQITPEELEIRMQLLKAQYKDPVMQAELEKPENRRDIGARLLTEKAVAKLVGYATK